MEAYLDNASTTRPLECVREIMRETLDATFGNPSSMHNKGFEAEKYVKKAKEIVAASLKAEEKEIIFTSGGTESNNMALIGTAVANKRQGKHLITTKIEHASVHNPLIFLEEQGYEVTYLNVDKNGLVDMKQLEEAIRPDTTLVSVMYVNNEIGTCERIADIAELIKKKNPKTLFHVDAIQGYGKYKIIPKKLGIDLLSISGHKLHGPKGVGVLYVRDKVKIQPIIHGGGQQNNMRSGTENVPGIAGLGAAVSAIYTDHAEKVEHLYKLKEHFIEQVQKIEGVHVNGVTDIPVRETAPHVVSVSFEGIRAEVLLHALEEKNIYVSSGSACASNHPQLSGTLQAIGVNKELLDSTIRFSFSVTTSMEETIYALDTLKELLPQLRRFYRH